MNYSTFYVTIPYVGDRSLVNSVNLHVMVLSAVLTEI